MVCDKFKFGFWKRSGIFFLNIFDTWLIEFTNEQPTGTEGQLYI